MLFAYVQPADGWEFGAFESGDLFVYDVCDYSTIDPLLGSIRDCYVLELSVIDRVASSFGPVWIIHVIMAADDYDIYDIILVDDAFNIYPFDSRYASESLSSTIFWINHYARITYFDSVIGELIDTKSPFFEQSEIIVNDFTSFDNYVIYDVSFDGDRVSGNMQIRNDVYLPVGASIFSVREFGDSQLFTFELISITDSSWGVTNYSDGFVPDANDYANFEQRDSNYFINDTTHFDDITDSRDGAGLTLSSLLPHDGGSDPSNIVQNMSNHELSEINITSHIFQNMSETISDEPDSISEQKDDLQLGVVVESVPENVSPTIMPSDPGGILDDMVTFFDGLLETLREFFP